MRTRTVNLTERLDTFIEDGVNAGRFSDASDVVREGLRLLEQREAEDQAKLHWLRSAASESFAAIDRGEGTTFDGIDELAAFIEHAGEQIAAGQRRA